MLRLLSKKKGVTLIELLITLALIGIIITIIMTLQLFSLNAFKKGDDQSNIQGRIRLAADFMTKELRNAFKIEILSSMPSTKDPQKRYFYIEDNKIKYYFAGIEKDVLSSSPPNLVLTISFNKSTTTANQKVLNYTVNSVYKQQNFTLTSSVFPMNTKNSSDITGLTDGVVVSYSSPLTDAETVNTDKILLELRDYNLILQQEADGSLTLFPPTPNALTLTPIGKNGSIISWSSANINLVKNNGAIIRPGVSNSDKSVILTATFTKDSAAAQKTFTVKIKKLEPLIINSEPLPEAAIGSAYMHVFSATQGTGVYTYSVMPDDLSSHGLTLNANGRLEGTVTGDAGSYPYTITVKDDFINDGFINVGFLSPNESSQTVTLVVK